MIIRYLFVLKFEYSRFKMELWSMNCLNIQMVSKFRFIFANTFCNDKEGKKKTLPLSSIQYESALLNRLIREVVLFPAR